MTDVIAVHATTVMVSMLRLNAVTSIMVNPTHRTVDMMTDNTPDSTLGPDLSFTSIVVLFLMRHLLRYTHVKDHDHGSLEI